MRRIELLCVNGKWEASNVGHSFAEKGPPVDGWPRLVAALDALGIDTPPPDVAVDVLDGTLYELAG